MVGLTRLYIATGLKFEIIYFVCEGGEVPNDQIPVTGRGWDPLRVRLGPLKDTKAADLNKKPFNFIILKKRGKNDKQPKLFFLLIESFSESKPLAIAYT